MRGPLVAMAVPCVLLATGCARTAQPKAARGWSAAEDIASSRKVGPAPWFRPAPTGALVADAAPVEGMTCRSSYPVASAAHVELFAANHVVIIPAGIGFAPPLRRHGAYVRGGRCVYPLRTAEPTGVVLVSPGATRTLGELFSLWGQRLNRHEVAGFSAGAGREVSVFRDGVRWQGDPAKVPLSSGAQITIEVGAYVPPHARYLFPPLRAISAVEPSP
jgi:hypothetical protein